MRQATLIVGALLTAFVIYLLITGRLAAYWALLTGGQAAAQSASTGGSTAGDAQTSAGGTTTPPVTTPSDPSGTGTNYPAIDPSTISPMVGGWYAWKDPTSGATVIQHNLPPGFTLGSGGTITAPAPVVTTPPAQQQGAS